MRNLAHIASGLALGFDYWGRVWYGRIASAAMEGSREIRCLLLMCGLP